MSKTNKKMDKVNASSKTQARSNMESNAQSNAQATNKTNSNDYNSCSNNTNCR